MGNSGKGKALIITVCILLAAILIIPCQVANAENYICIGQCETPINPIPENLPPHIDPIPSQNILENSLLEFPLNVSDPENNISYIYAIIPFGSTLMANGANFTFRWIPDYLQAGVHYANFTLVDGGGLTDNQNVTIVVTNVNRAPVFGTVQDFTAPENTLISFSLPASDPDGDATSFGNVTPLPRGATLDGLNGVFEWIPDYSQNGIYLVNFSASDGSDASYVIVVITVVDMNRPPILDEIGDITTTENAPITFTLYATDSDSDPVTYGNVTSLPIGASLNPSNGIFTWTPSYSQNGTYLVTFLATDGIDFAFTQGKITVINVNRPAVFGAQIDRTVAENNTLSIPLIATDPDSNPLTYGNVTPLPDGALLNTSTGEFLWTPAYTQNGTYPMNFSVSDGVFMDFVVFNITVTDVNVPPIITVIGEQQVQEGLILNFTIQAIDPGNDALRYNATPLPSRAIFNTSTGAFSWIPNYTQSGTYNVNFTVADTSGLFAYEIVTIVVAEPTPIKGQSVNYAPIFDPMSDQVAAETYLNEYILSAADFDSPTLTYKAILLPPGAIFNPITKTLLWTPAYGSRGLYWAKFSVSDGSVSDSMSFIIQVVGSPVPSEDSQGVG